MTRTDGLQATWRSALRLHVGNDLCGGGDTEEVMMQFEIRRVCRCLCETYACAGCGGVFTTCKLMSLYDGQGSLTGEKMWVCGQECLDKIGETNPDFKPLQGRLPLGD